MRVVGRLVAVEAAPGWDMGGLTRMLNPGAEGAPRVHGSLAALGFAHREAAATYGFIYGRATIDHLVSAGTRSIR